MTTKNPVPVACRECDALMAEPRIEPGGSVHCVRCGAELFRSKPGCLDLTLAFMLSAAVLFLVANAYPLMRLDANGIDTSATILDLSLALRDQEMPSVGALVLATTIVVPALHIVFALAVLVPLRLGYVPDVLPVAFRAMSIIWPWGMVEVFLLGCLVAFVKLRDVAIVEPGLGLYAVAGYILAISSAVAAFEKREIWARVDEINAMPNGEARRT